MQTNVIIQNEHSVMQSIEIWMGVDRILFYMLLYNNDQLPCLGLNVAKSSE